VAFQSLKDLYQRYEKWVPLTFFLAGFTFDATVLRRIDDPITIVQQAVYLLVAAFIIYFDLLEELHLFEPSPWLQKIWRYREGILHFMLGTLMNGYTIFYFKSASLISSLVFVGILVVTLTVTEFKNFGGAQRAFHFALLALCTLSYFIYTIPLLLGWVGIMPFIGSVAASAGVLSLYYRQILKRLFATPHVVYGEVLAPFMGVHLFFLLLYFTRLIPPVPLSIEFVGIYHDVKKENGEFVLTSLERTHHWWRRHGDTVFLYRPGDKVFCFAQIFSPTRFKDQIQVRWLFDSPRSGWEKRDLIPISISGGREEGFRGFTSKGNFEPGDWRVQLETTDGREIGRIYFTVEKDDETGERALRTEKR
jgi:hypothetical protein